MLKAEHRVEDALRRAKSEAGLGHYQVRTWAGWHHHQALALVATWFLTVEVGRGKEVGAGADSPATPGTDRRGVGATAGDVAFGVHPSHREPALTPDRGGAVLSLESA